MLDSGFSLAKDGEMKRIKLDAGGCFVLMILAGIVIPLLFMVVFFVGCVFQSFDSIGVPQSLEQVEIVGKHSSGGSSWTQFINVGNGVVVPVTHNTSKKWSLRVRGNAGERTIYVKQPVFSMKKNGDKIYVVSRTGRMTGTVYYSSL